MERKRDGPLCCGSPERQRKKNCAQLRAPSNHKNARNKDEARLRKGMAEPPLQVAAPTTLQKDCLSYASSSNHVDASKDRRSEARVGHLAVPGLTVRRDYPVALTTPRLSFDWEDVNRSGRGRTLAGFSRSMISASASSCATTSDRHCFGFRSLSPWQTRRRLIAPTLCSLIRLEILADEIHRS